MGACRGRGHLFSEREVEVVEVAVPPVSDGVQHGGVVVMGTHHMDVVHHMFAGAVLTDGYGGGEGGGGTD